MSVYTFTKENFEEEVLNSKDIVLVDFWASWCGPCKMVAPIIDEVAQVAPAGTKIGKVNVDEQQDLAIKYGVMSIPTLAIFKNGEVVSSTVGVKTKEEILQMLKV